MQDYNYKSQEYYSASRQDILPFIPEKCNALLDVGCASGEFGAMLKRIRAVEFWGVEPQFEAASVAKERLDRVVVSPFVEGIDIPDSYFDVITLLDSLEHFPDPFPPLALCKKKLQKNWLVVCSLPNVRYIENLHHLLIEKDWRYTDSGILGSTHLKFFTKKSMQRTFEIAGYDVLSITGINPYLSYWSSWKIFILRQILRKLMEDTIYLQYVIIARPR